MDDGSGGRRAVSSEQWAGGQCGRWGSGQWADGGRGWRGQDGGGNGQAPTRYQKRDYRRFLCEIRLVSQEHTIMRLEASHGGSERLCELCETRREFGQAREKVRLVLRNAAGSPESPWQSQLRGIGSGRGILRNPAKCRADAGKTGGRPRKARKGGSRMGDGEWRMADGRSPIPTTTPARTQRRTVTLFDGVSQGFPGFSRAITGKLEAWQRKALGRENRNRLAGRSWRWLISGNVL